MSSIDARIAALTTALQRRQKEQAAPVDPLSASLFEMGRELAALDEQGKVTLLQAFNNPGDGETDGLRVSNTYTTNEQQKRVKIRKIEIVYNFIGAFDFEGVRE